MIQKVIIFFFICLSPCLSNAKEIGQKDLYIWSLEDKVVLSSKEKIQEAIHFAKQQGIKTIFLQVYRANQAWFPSQTADSSPYQKILNDLSEDPFALFIKKAHEQGIEVHAWMNMLSLSANKEARILKKYGPDILTRNLTVKNKIEDYKIDNQYFLEPGDPRVRKELMNVVGELLKAYPDLDGIQFDYIRYPDVHPFYGYSPDNIKRFKKLTGLKKITDKNPQWQQFKRDQVTSLLRALIEKTRSIRPKIHISTTGCLSYYRAMDEAFQEWPFWINTNMVEFVTVMNYPPDALTFWKNIQEIKPYVQDLSKVNMAVGAYKKDQSVEDFKGQWEYCKKSGVRSCVLFHYDSLIQKPSLKRELES